MKKLILITICLAGLMCAGCIKGISESGEKTYALDPNAGVKVEQTIDASLSVATLASTFFPWLLTIIAPAVAIYGTWKRVKPKLVEAQGRADMYYNVTESVVTGIEDYKEANPDERAKLGAILTKFIGPEAENVIRAMRNLPSKT